MSSTRRNAPPWLVSVLMCLSCAAAVEPEPVESSEKAIPALLVKIAVTYGIAECVADDWCRGVLAGALAHAAAAVQGGVNLASQLTNWNTLASGQKEETVQAIERLAQSEAAAPSGYDPDKDLEGVVPGSTKTGAWPESMGPANGVPAADGPLHYLILHNGIYEALFTLNGCYGSDAHIEMHEHLLKTWKTAWFGNLAELPREVLPALMEAFDRLKNDLAECDFEKSLLREVVCGFRAIMLIAVGPTSKTVQAIEHWTKCD